MQPTLFPSGPSTPALEWCSNDNTMGKSAFDAAEVYTAAGYAESSDGESLYLYYGGMAYTHNENPSTASGRHNSAIGAAKLRMDGFVSLNAPQVFNVATAADLPTFTTVPLLVPSASTCPPPTRVPTNKTCPGNPPGNLDGSCTTCAYLLPSVHSCGSGGFKPVTCTTVADCEHAADQRNTTGLTCGGKVVGCTGGVCRSSPLGIDQMCRRAPGTSINLDGGLVLKLNVHTGVAGAVYTELLDASSPVTLASRPPALPDLSFAFQCTPVGV